MPPRDRNKPYLVCQKCTGYGTPDVMVQVTFPSGKSLYHRQCAPNYKAPKATKLELEAIKSSGPRPL